MQCFDVFQSTDHDIDVPRREQGGGARASRRNSCRARSQQALALALLIAIALGCAAVRGRRGAPEHAGFLGDYSDLAPREGYEAQEVYINPRAEWARYDAIHLDSVTLWANERTAQFGEEERQMLSDLLYASLAAELGERFQLATRPGPSVLRMRAALTQAKGASVPLRTLSSIVPPMFVISTALGLSADAAATVGTATIEVEIVDSITGRRLAAAVDQRAGTKSILAGSRTFETWGDVEAACKFWAERAADALERLGVRKKG
jgi:hypothetical protein